jgi:hypothetical protein
MIRIRCRTIRYHVHVILVVVLERCGRGGPAEHLGRNSPACAVYRFTLSTHWHANCHCIHCCTSRQCCTGHRLVGTAYNGHAGHGGSHPERPCIRPKAYASVQPSRGSCGNRLIWIGSVLTPPSISNPPHIELACRKSVTCMAMWVRSQGRSGPYIYSRACEPFRITTTAPQVSFSSLFVKPSRVTAVIVDNPNENYK